MHKCTVPMYIQKHHVFRVLFQTNLDLDKRTQSSTQIIMVSSDTHIIMVYNIHENIKIETFTKCVCSQNLYLRFHFDKPKPT